MVWFHSFLLDCCLALCIGQILGYILGSIYTFISFYTTEKQFDDEQPLYIILIILYTYIFCILNIEDN
jgi:hypothetical protein